MLLSLIPATLRLVTASVALPHFMWQSHQLCKLKIGDNNLGKRDKLKLTNNTANRTYLDVDFAMATTYTTYDFNTSLTLTLKRLSDISPA
jgi:hypothetical protein